MNDLQYLESSLNTLPVVGQASGKLRGVKNNLPINGMHNNLNVFVDQSIE